MSLPPPPEGTAAPTWPRLLSRLLDGHDLTAADTSWAMREVMTGEATPAQVAAFAVALRAKGESPDEVAGMAAAMLDQATPVPLSMDCVDIVGTGGDGAHTVNISTMAAIVTAAAGVPVAKHGNRAASSTSGAADVLEALGVVIDLPAAGVSRCVEEAGIGFFFAPVFHPGMRHTAVPRREMGIRTVFNFLGPLTNPARPVAAAVGCADARMAPVLAAVLAGRGGRALVFRGDDGLDELTTATTSSVWVVRDGEVVAERLDPGALGLPASGLDALRGGDAAANADVVRRLVAGERGPVRDAVLLNAAAALAAADPHATRLHDALRAGLARAGAAVDDGRASALLDRWTAVSRAARDTPH
ncbi:anthranilate phosphoribosyltransferase [Modestobacter sp. I12A-02628]|uniref:Anthranilate phosphoribosyltransferase n=1 Tax=Goekera deserti TaxID=2497753 RepID=A0A7K3WAY4_9ACTN|nr:anthranilate phosphoribosyltransferase [Goekera deserti]MPQ97658.1 anthranilate phosphoribosyltransferase [Goekera deserti]NDI47738.1 anthranilate phosphoribosyltransferase [Goekera deserti]NEL53486.1 anthranilate phosphoribosyltransferase [Goekera deserti]